VTVTIMEPDSGWASEFDGIAERIRAAVGDDALATIRFPVSPMIPRSGARRSSIRPRAVDGSICTSLHSRRG